MKPASVAQTFPDDKVVIQTTLNYTAQNTQLKGTGESIRRDSDNKTFRRAAPLWLDCQFMITAHIGLSAFEQENYLQTADTQQQAESLLFSAIIGLTEIENQIPDTYLTGSFAPDTGDNQIQSLRFDTITRNQQGQLMLQASMTASMHIMDEIEPAPPIKSIAIENLDSIE